MLGAPFSRRDLLKAAAAAALAASGAFPARAAADPSRVALVIGNNSYPRAPLRNAVNDAKAVAGLLERAGFAVTLKTDVDRDALRGAAAAFGAAARESEAKQVLFYYAGHGTQLNWRNFLVPVDARIARAEFRIEIPFGQVPTRWDGNHRRAARIDFMQTDAVERGVTETPQRINYFRSPRMRATCKT
jgi:Caspase domain